MLSPIFSADAKQLKWEVDRDRWLRGSDKRSFNKKKGPRGSFKGGQKKGKAKQGQSKRGRR